MVPWRSPSAIKVIPELAGDELAGGALSSGEVLCGALVHSIVFVLVIWCPHVLESLEVASLAVHEIRVDRRN